MPFSVTPVQALTDNYMYLIVDKDTMQAAVVDPCEPTKLMETAYEQEASIVAALTTHHHFDHAGGNNDLKKMVPSVQVYGGDDVQGLTTKVMDNQTFKVGNLDVRCVHTPAHTSGHMSYLVSDPAVQGEAAIFTGDALFVGGCGRFFEGGPEQMLEGSRKLAQLPLATRLYCGHEYTVKNLQFALTVEPNNEAAQRKIVWAQEVCGRGEFTVPSTIGEELEHNPFMRVDQKAVRAHVGFDGERTEAEDVKVMQTLRNAKDKFAGSSRPWIPGGGPLPGL